MGAARPGECMDDVTLPLGEPEAEGSTLGLSDLVDVGVAATLGVGGCEEWAEPEWGGALAGWTTGLPASCFSLME